MKVFQRFSGICLLAFTLMSLQWPLTAADFSMSETCAYLAWGNIANPDNCQSYGYCSNGKLLGTALCPSGFLFDITTGGCNYADKATCATTLPTSCNSTRNEGFIANPSDCRQACYCNENNKYTCELCPPEQVFNRLTKTCVWSSQYKCPTGSICRLVPNNQLVGDPFYCGKYLSCLNGDGLSLHCDVGKLFDPKVGSCTTEYVCDNHSTVPPTTLAPGSDVVGPGVLQYLPPKPEVCATNAPGEFKPYFVSDGMTCMGFYVCDDSYGLGIWSKCPMGTHFNEALQYCVTPYTVRCPYDRCGNSDQQFMSDLGCQSYSFCVNQTRVSGSGGTCANNNPAYPYFNEFTGACSNIMPDYAICSDM